MAKIRRVDFSPDEWIAGTRELTLEERGAYWDVCALIYSRGGPIADDEGWIAKALTCHVRTWRTIRARLLALGKLVLVDGKLANGRTLREIQKAESRLKTSRDAAEESARARRERAENARSSNDYSDIPEASASDFDGAIQQRTTINDSSNGENLGGDMSTAPQACGADERGEPEVSGRKAGSRRARAGARGMRLPDGWQPSPELEQFARDLGLDPARVTPEFVDYWRGVAGQAGVKLDWDATYRNRCRQMAGWKGNNGLNRNRTRAPESQPGDSATSAGIAAAFARRSVQSG